MRHLDHAFQSIHMFAVQIIARLVGDGHARKDVPRQARDGLATVAQQLINLFDLIFCVIANFGIPNELKFGIGQIKFVHEIDRVLQIAADAVANNAQLHEGFFR